MQPHASRVLLEGSQRHNMRWWEEEPANNGELVEGALWGEGSTMGGGQKVRAGGTLSR